MNYGIRFVIFMNVISSPCHKQYFIHMEIYKNFFSLSIAEEEITLTG